MATSTVSYLWRDHNASKGFSYRRLAAQPHQSIQRNTGFFIQSRQQVSRLYVLFLAHLERRAHQKSGMRVNYAAAYWTPPLTPQALHSIWRNGKLKISI